MRVRGDLAIAQDRVVRRLSTSLALSLAILSSACVVRSAEDSDDAVGDDETDTDAASTITTSTSTSETTGGDGDPGDGDPGDGDGDPGDGDGDPGDGDGDPGDGDGDPGDGDGDPRPGSCVINSDCGPDMACVINHLDFSKFCIDCLTCVDTAIQPNGPVSPLLMCDDDEDCCDQPFLGGPGVCAGGMCLYDNPC